MTLPYTRTSKQIRLDFVTASEAFQRRCAFWRKHAHPNDGVSWVIAKLAEESGEVARAVIGEHEDRSGRGDAVSEAAQVVLVLASMVGMYYPNRNLLNEALEELERQEKALNGND